jgi:hypothetical protein
MTNPQKMLRIFCGLGLSRRYARKDFGTPS